LARLERQIRAPEPEVSEYSREYQYIWHDNLDTREYVIQDCKRLESFECGDFAVMYLSVVVTHSETGIQLGSASLSGIESDSDELYIQSTFRELLHEALQDARSNKAKLAA